MIAPLIVIEALGPKLMNTTFFIVHFMDTDSRKHETTHTTQTLPSHSITTTVVFER